MVKQFQGQYRWLSNFWPCVIEYEGVEFLSVEHAYQASKSLDKLERQSILYGAHTPGEAKSMGKSLTLRPDWEEVKLDIMHSLLRKKFQEEFLRKKLLATGDELLQEGNYWRDKFWGVDLKTGEGKNWLGVLLMKVRNEILKEEVK